MDTSWWLAVAAAVALGLVAVLVDGLGRLRGRARRTGVRGRPPARRPVPRATPGRPRAREIWWARVPYEDGPGGKDRPCLVLSVHGNTALVAKITSRYHDGRPGVIPLAPGSVVDAQGRESFLESGELRRVPLGDFRRRQGEVDPAVWDQVRHLG
ncbi:type II toxin-antitoxin system PemK/MazF family toxin [Streptomyces netropsis]|uniref:type II toxin-antitoxin system PemK/MazF family toxin n=1 Tax=Streptomyces netropsis TaxID=55404 RepID=UPI00379074A6